MRPSGLCPQPSSSWRRPGCPRLLLRDGCRKLGVFMLKQRWGRGAVLETRLARATVLEHSGFLSARAGLSLGRGETRLS